MNLIIVTAAASFFAGYLTGRLLSMSRITPKQKRVAIPRAVALPPTDGER